MALPFGEDEFLEIFQSYNHAIWPMQIIAYILGTIIIYLIYKKTKSSFSLIAGILGFLWLWTGIVYQIIFFSAINNAAILFGIIFVIQGLFFIVYGIKYNETSIDNRMNLFGMVGGIFIVYAMIIYPIFGYLFGHGYPNAPMFGIAPCPLTIFTVGVLLFIDHKKSRHLVIIPLIWSIIGFNAAISLSIYEDMGLLISGIVGTTLIFLRPRIEEYLEKRTIELETKPKQSHSSSELYSTD